MGVRARAIPAGFFCLDDHIDPLTGRRIVFRRINVRFRICLFLNSGGLLALFFVRLTVVSVLAMTIALHIAYAGRCGDCSDTSYWS